MQLHELKFRLRKKTRIGRGGKRGNYSGRGLKGQKSRSGRNIRPAERDLILRIPKLRGYNNKSFKEKPTIINLRDIAKINADIVNQEVLIEQKLIRKNTKKVKILGGSDLKKPIKIKGLTVSKSVKTKIESARLAGIK